MELRKKNSQTKLCNISSLDSEKLEVMDLAIAYYKLSKYNNPLGIECLFSCMRAIVRSLMGKNSYFDLRREAKNK